MNEIFFEKYAWIIFLIIDVMDLIDAIPHTFVINADPALVQVISDQTINETKLSNSITFESSVLLLLIKDFKKSELAVLTPEIYLKGKSSS